MSLHQGLFDGSERSGRWPNGSRQPTCHPDRKHTAVGLCQSCYHMFRVKSDPEYRRRHIESVKKWARKPEVRSRKNARKLERLKNDPEFRARNRKWGREWRKRPENRQKVSQWHRNWYLRHRVEKVESGRNARFLRLFGITTLDYEKLLAHQNGRCAICDRTSNGNHLITKKRLAVDHSHRIGIVRGLLCDKCNQGIGAFQDNVLYLMRAIQYLAEPPFLQMKEKPA